MKKLIFLGLELNVATEHEILSNDATPFGYDAVIVYKDGRGEVRHNLTEVHHLFKTLFEPSIAFESDIHGTGGTAKVEDIEIVVVLIATSKAENY